MVKFNQGDIVLIPYPYTDLSNTKKRPVVIISKDAINKQNFIVSKITSVIRNDQFTFSIKATDTEIKLRFKSEVRTNEIFTVHRSLIIKKLTSFEKESLKHLTEKIKEHISVN
ncbi:MAG: MazF family transcriptional regulator [Flavobacteriales bacterium CG18_big_fil_WC_8_21_14_2_50_32_9]|nr:MAG: MazF family transcriptional regulator [Flavobacteriales bacterium CG18_big_fil_WC_8_21_14_2_50_32_9]